MNETVSPQVSGEPAPQWPAGPGVRVDSGVGPGGEVSPMYDPMVSKLIVWDVDRDQATQRMLRALGEYEIEGLTTLIPFHDALLRTEQWARAETCRDLVEDKDWLKATAPDPAPAPPTGDDGEPLETVEQSYTVEVSGRRFDVNVIGPAFAGAVVLYQSGTSGQAVKFVLCRSGRSMAIYHSSATFQTNSVLQRQQAG